MLPPRAEDAEFGNGAPVATAGGNGAGGDLVPVQQEQQISYLPATSWPVGPTRPEILTAGPDPVSLFHALKRRWLMATGCGIVAAIAMALFGFWLWPETYEVDALLRVNRASNQILPGTTGRIDPNAYESSLRTQVSLIKSDDVLIAALRNPAISQLPAIRAEGDRVGFIQDEMVVDNPRESELLRISMRGEDPVQLQKIIDGVIASYWDKHVDAERTRQLQELQRLKDGLKQREEAFEAKNETLSGLLTDIETGSENLETLRMLKINQLSQLNVDKRELKTEIRNADRSLRELKMQQQYANETGVHNLTVERELLADREYQNLMAELEEAQEAFRAVDGQYVNQESHPTYQARRARVQKAEEELDARKFELAPQIEDMLLNADTVADEIVSQQEAKTNMEADLKEIDEQVQETSMLLAQITSSSPEIRKLEAEMSRLSGIMNELNRQVEGKELELDAEPAIQKVQPATIPETSDWLRRLMLVAFAAVAGFGMAVFGVAIWEFQSRRVNSQEQITEGLGLRLVGTLPNLSSRNRMLSLGRGNRASLEGMLTESIDSIRAALIHSANGSTNQVVLVTSALDQEGKTTVASQLAVSLARSGRRTLLVDADLRNPTGHKLFELSLEDGISEALCGQVELDDVVRPTRAPGLWMISAGRCTLESLQEMAKGGLQSMFARLKPQFDFIVVDSAPVLTVADTLVVGQAADAVVLSVLRGVSRVPKVYEASERLESVGIHVLGAVVNGATGNSHRRTYELSLPSTS